MLKASRAFRKTSIAAVLSLSTFAVAGCSATSTESKSSKTLLLANAQGAPTTYNPWAPGYGINRSLWWSQALYDSLVTLDTKGNAQPSLATSWKENGSSLTLKLRTDVKFSDGASVDAEAVKANMDYAVAHPSGAECNAYLAGMTTTVQGSDSVTMVTPSPFPGLLQDLGQCAGFIVNPKALSSDSSLTAIPAGSGPYTLDKADTVAGQKYTFVRNAGYWNNSAYPYDKVVITQYGTSTAATNAVQSGQADLVSGLLQSQVKGLGPTVKTAGGDPNLLSGIWFIDLKGTISKPMGDLRVRQAMNYAIDRKTIVSSLLGDSGLVSASTPFAKYYEGYSTSLADLYPYDVTKAKQLLSDAGYADGFSVNVVTNSGGIQIAEAMAGMLSKVGITLNITSVISNLPGETQTGKFAMVMAAYTLNGAQYQTIRGIVGPNGFWNPLHNSDPDVMKLLDQIPGASDSEASALYSKLATTIAQKALLLAPGIGTQLTVYDPKKVKNEYVPGIDRPMLYDIAPVS